ncbi:MAG TPA: glycogen debranching enzyme, partial [Ruminococcus bromii]|nr:glycogen debranching enzyme [Ruminococcus bromii]
NNTDGANDNNSWNCGAEGDTNDYNINKLRIKMIKNAFATLMCSQGPALFLAGDEFCNTQFGNNNAYCQDNIISWLDWTRKEKHKDVFEFFKYMIAFRKRFHIITDSRGKATCSYPPVSIHSNVAWSAKYYDDTRMIGVMYAGVSLKQQGLDEFVYFGVNAYWDYVNVELPDLPEGYH